MRLATIRTVTGQSRAVRVEDSDLVDLRARDLGEFLARSNWRERAAAATEPAREVTDDAAFDPVVPRPGKIICVGHNYRSHILEMGRELPAYPTLFAKVPARQTTDPLRQGDSALW